MSPIDMFNGATCIVLWRAKQEIHKPYIIVNDILVIVNNVLMTVIN